ncbi:MAG: hypothetical protein A2007_02040 [Verrucomicrobia bacterium GWC2_42_7]|nr:MAG: hypothetical protein A2007_02040 [Verrucomicrobia bacterium GWC2_42_7]
MDNHKTYLNGKLLDAGESEVAPFQFILLGSTYLTIGPDNQTWPEISVQSAPAIQPDSPSLPGDTAALSSQSESEEKLTRPLQPTKGSLSGKKTLLSFLFFTFLILVVAFLSLRFLFPRPLVTPDDPPEVREEKLISALNEVIKSQLVPPEKVTIEKENGYIFFTGYVLTREKKTLLKTLTQDLGAREVKMKVWAQEAIVESAQDTLNFLKSSLKAEPSANPSSIKLSGYIFDENALPKIKERLLGEVAGLKEIEEAVLTPEKIKNLVQVILNKYNIVPYIQIYPLAEGLYLKGSIDKSISSNWISAQKEIRTTFSSLFPIKTQVNIASSQKLKKNFFGVETESVTLGNDGTSWIVSRGGTKFLEGSTLPSGYKIIKIEPEGISLEKNNEKLTIRMEDL